MLQEAKKIGQRKIKEFIKLKLFPIKHIKSKKTGSTFIINNPQEIFEECFGYNYDQAKLKTAGDKKSWFKIPKFLQPKRKRSLPEKEKPPKRRKSEVTVVKVDNPLLRALGENRKNKENIPNTLPPDQENMPIPSNTQKALKRLMKAKAGYEKQKSEQGPKPPKNSATPSGK